LFSVASTTPFEAAKKIVLSILSKYLKKHKNLFLKHIKAHNIHEALSIIYCSVSQTVVRGPQVVLGFCPCGPLRLNISPKNTEKY
jgi:hypothetical protein